MSSKGQRLNIKQLRDWLELAGIFGVILSLVFVGYQLKQDREIALSMAMQARTETTIQTIQGLASNPILASALDKVERGESHELLRSERRAMALSAKASLYNLDNTHWQFSNGFLSEEKWIASRAALKLILSQTQEARRTYEQNPSEWRESFRQVIDELILEIDAEDTGGQ